jgi:hypothetical protein
VVRIHSPRLNDSSSNDTLCWTQAHVYMDSELRVRKRELVLLSGGFRLRF